MKYQISSTHCSKVIIKVKVLKTCVKVTGNKITNVKTRNVGARTKVMGRINFSREHHCSQKQTCLEITYLLDYGKITIEFRGNPFVLNRD